MLYTSDESSDDELNYITMNCDSDKENGRQVPLNSKLNFSQNKLYSNSKTKVI